MGSRGPSSSWAVVPTSSAGPTAWPSAGPTASSVTGRASSATGASSFIGRASSVTASLAAAASSIIPALAWASSVIAGSSSYLRLYLLLYYCILFPFIPFHNAINAQNSLSRYVSWLIKYANFYNRITKGG